MKKIFKSFTIWFIACSVLIVFQHLFGNDSKSIVLIGLNPILNYIAGMKSLNIFMASGPRIATDSVLGPDRTISIYWYLGSVMTFAIYGLILDYIKYTIKRKINKK